MRHPFILLGVLLGLAGCDEPNHGLGNPCRILDDCDRPLICSNRDLPDGSLGVCVMEEALPDAAVPMPDAAFVVDAAPTADAST